MSGAANNIASFTADLQQLIEVAGNELNLTPDMNLADADFDDDGISFRLSKLDQGIDGRGWTLFQLDMRVPRAIADDWAVMRLQDKIVEGLKFRPNTQHLRSYGQRRDFTVSDTPSVSGTYTLELQNGRTWRPGTREPGLTHEFMILKLLYD